MSEIFALWGTALRRRGSVYGQLLLTWLATVVVATVAGVVALIPHTPGFLGVIFFLLAVGALSFGFGAAMGAAGEAVRADAPSDFWRRGRRLWGRTLGFFVAVALLALIVMLLAVFVLDVTGVFRSIQLVLAGGLAPTPDALALLSEDAGIAFLVTFVLALALGPLASALQAGVYVGELPVLEALRESFAEAFAGRRYLRWLLVTFIGLALGIAEAIVQALAGRLGSVVGLALVPLVIWVQSMLAFATYRIHRPGPKSAPFAPDPEELP